MDARTLRVVDVAAARLEIGLVTVERLGNGQWSVVIGNIAGLPTR